LNIFPAPVVELRFGEEGLAKGLAEGFARPAALVEKRGRKLLTCGGGGGGEGEGFFGGGVVVGIFFDVFFVGCCCCCCCRGVVTIGDVWGGFLESFAVCGRCCGATVSGGDRVLGASRGVGGEPTVAFA
jgi:hypothetical protein